MVTCVKLLSDLNHPMIKLPLQPTKLSLQSIKAQILRIETRLHPLHPLLLRIETHIDPCFLRINARSYPLLLIVKADSHLLLLLVDTRIDTCNLGSQASFLLIKTRIDSPELQRK